MQWCSDRGLGRHSRAYKIELWCEEQKYIVECGGMPPPGNFRDFRGIEDGNQVALRANLDHRLDSLYPLSHHI